MPSPYRKLRNDLYHCHHSDSANRNDCGVPEQMGNTSTETRQIHILHIEDNPGYATLVYEMLAEEMDFNCRLQHAGLLLQGIQKLISDTFDIILLDLNLPDSTGISTFQSIKKRVPETPIIIMTGLDDETTALEAVRKGAQDYLLKGELDVNLLLRSIRYSIEREKLTSDLRQSLARVKTLSGLLPICASCKNIRDDHGSWHKVEVFVRDHSNADFTHGLCPKCIYKLYPELNNDNQLGNQ